MHAAFFKAVADVASADPEMVLLTGDADAAAADMLHVQMPDRVYHLGTSNATMVGIAAGLARTQHRVFVLAMAPVIDPDICELLRRDVCPAGLPVIIAGAYRSRHRIHDRSREADDLAAVRTLPGMTILAPGDAAEVQAVVRALAVHDGPAYLCLDNFREVPGEDEEPVSFTIGRARVLREGRDVTLIGCGAILTAALEAAAELNTSGVRARVLDMASIAPLDADAIADACRETRALITIEEHSCAGGLGAAVADLLAGMPVHPPLKTLGSEELDGEGIARRTRALLDSLRS